MNELQVFSYNSSEVRTVMRDGEPWFVLKDVCRVLEISDHKVVIRRLDKDEVCQIPLTDSMGRKQKTWLINESGLYSVILRSDKPEAKPFRKWVTSEVLPTIRKTGRYGVDGTKAALAEAKLNNSRARVASAWMKISKENPVSSYKQVCAHYASAALAGREVLPLPDTGERTYTAAEVGAMLGGISANKVGRVANQNGLKTPEYGTEVWDKSPHSAKQVPTWRYNDKAVEALRQLLEGADHETV